MVALPCSTTPHRFRTTALSDGLRALALSGSLKVHSAPTLAAHGHTPGADWPKRRCSGAVSVRATRRPGTRRAVHQQASAYAHRTAPVRSARVPWRQGTIGFMTSVPTAPDAPPAIRLTPSVIAASYAHPDARRLTQDLRAEQLGLYGFADDPDTTPEADFDPPHGLFLTAHVGERRLGVEGYASSTSTAQRSNGGTSPVAPAATESAGTSSNGTLPAAAQPGSCWKPDGATRPPWPFTTAPVTCPVPPTSPDATTESTGP